MAVAVAVAAEVAAEAEGGSSVAALVVGVVVLVGGAGGGVGGEGAAAVSTCSSRSSSPCKIAVVPALVGVAAGVTINDISLFLLWHPWLLLMSDVFYVSFKGAQKNLSHFTLAVLGLHVSL